MRSGRWMAALILTLAVAGCSAGRVAPRSSPSPSPTPRAYVDIKVDPQGDRTAGIHGQVSQACTHDVFMFNGATLFAELGKTTVKAEHLEAQQDGDLKTMRGDCPVVRS